MVTLVCGVVIFVFRGFAKLFFSALYNFSCHSAADSIHFFIASGYSATRSFVAFLLLVVAVALALL